LPLGCVFARTGHDGKPTAIVVRGERPDLVRPTVTLQRHLVGKRNGLPPQLSVVGVARSGKGCLDWILSGGDL
jgi:hypothetical protein